MGGDFRVKNINYNESKYGQVSKILGRILILNILVASAKVIYGYISNTGSMIADGIHSLSDGASNIVGIIGMRISSKPADENHPYGHQKVETLSTIAISFLLFFVGIRIAIDAYDRAINPTEARIGFLNFAIMIATLVVNFFIVSYEKAKGKQLKSSILISDAKHTESDMYTSISVIVGLISVRLGFQIVDPIVSFVISIFILRAGFEILKDGIDVLMDAQMLNTDKIHDIVMDCDEAIYCHKIRTRGKEDHIMIDLHVGIDSDISIERAHKIAHGIENKIIEKVEGVYEVIVHVEPARSKVRR